MANIEKYSSVILIFLFIIEWIIAMLTWLIANPLIGLKEFLFYFHLMFGIILVPFFFNLLSLIHKSKQSKKITIINLSYGILVWVLAQIIGFTQFNEISFLVFYLAQMICSTSVVLVSFIIIDHKIKKGIFFSLYNVIYSLIFLTLPLVIFEFLNIPLFLTIISMVIFWFTLITQTLGIILYKKMKGIKSPVEYKSENLI